MRNKMSDHHKDQLLDALMHHLPMDVRGRIMNEVPAAYNAYCEQNSGTMPCVVVRHSDVSNVVADVAQSFATPESVAAKLFSLSEAEAQR